MTTFYLARHGETRWNIEKRWQGQQDSRLKKIAAKHPKETLLIIAHGGNLRNLLGHIGYLPLESLETFALGNAAYAVCQFDGKNFSVTAASGVRQGKDGLRDSLKK